MMALEKYKICPACGEHNPPGLLECRKCETDLTGIRVSDGAMEQKAAEEAVKVPEAQRPLRRPPAAACRAQRRRHRSW